MANYKNTSQQRIIKVMLRLAGHELTGIAPGEIARALNISPSAVSRDLANLHIAGLAEQLPESSNWRLTPRLSQIGLAMLSSAERARFKVDEIVQRYTRDPH